MHQDYLLKTRKSLKCWNIADLQRFQIKGCWPVFWQSPFPLLGWEQRDIACGQLIISLTNDLVSHCGSGALLSGLCLEKITDDLSKTISRQAFVLCSHFRWLTSDFTLGGCWAHAGTSRKAIQARVGASTQWCFRMTYQITPGHAGHKLGPLAAEDKSS